MLHVRGRMLFGRLVALGISVVENKNSDSNTLSTLALSFVKRKKKKTSLL